MWSCIWFELKNTLFNLSNFTRLGSTLPLMDVFVWRLRSSDSKCVTYWQDLRIRSLKSPFQKFCLLNISTFSRCSCKSCIFHQFSEWILHVSEICIPKTAFWTATEILICTNDIVGGGQPPQCSVEHSSQLLFPQFSPPLLCTASSLLRIIVHFQDYKWNTQKKKAWKCSKLQGKCPVKTK